MVRRPVPPRGADWSNDLLVAGKASSRSRLVNVKWALRIETSLGWKAIFTDSSVSDTLRSMSDIALAGITGGAARAGS